MKRQPSPASVSLELLTEDHGATAPSLLAGQAAAAGPAEGALPQGLSLVRRGFRCRANSKGESGDCSLTTFTRLF